MVGINSNLISGSATRNLGSANNTVSSSVARLSSGNRIIKASDDVAGLAIGTSIKSTVNTLQIALLNTQQAGSVLSIADGALAQIGDILGRQKALATQANSGSLGATERGYLDQEFQALVSEIDRIVDSTSFNGITLLNGTLGASTDGLSALANTTTFGTTTSLYSGTVGSTAVNATTPAITISSGSANARSDNAIFQGSLADIEITANTFTANNAAIFTLNFGGATYKSGSVDLSTANTNRTVTFTRVDGNATGTFTVDINTYSIPTTTANIQTIADNIEADLDGLTIYQSRTLSTATGAITSTTLDGTVLEGLDGGDFQIVGTSFDLTGNTAPAFGPFSVTAETTDSDAVISTTLGGVNYSTVADQFDSTDADNLNTGSLGGGTGIIRLYKDGDSTTNPNEYIDIDIDNGGTPTIDQLQLDSAGAAQLLEDALNTAVGNGSAGALSFQVGSATTDSIAVSISSVATGDIYLNDSDVATTIDITTQSNAQDAIEVLDNALASVVSRRADVGAAQSRFNFAASNLEVSISNQDAARGSFLDADIATESTAFATAQVKLQASVAVLAQANQLPSTLLQLLQ